MSSLVAVLLTTSVAAVANAQSFSELLPEVLSTHDRVKAAKSDLESAKEGVNVALGDFKPTVSVSAEAGHENQNKVTGSTDTSTGYNQFTLSGTQLLWDMDVTPQSIDRARQSAVLAEMRLRSTTQDLIRESLDAYLNLFRAFNSYNYAIQSEDNIKIQTGLEEALVERNSGLASDLLQAQSSLAGAQAARLQAEGALINAQNRYRNVFKRESENLENYLHPRLPTELVPGSLDEAIEKAHENNLSLKIASMEVAIAQASARIDEISFKTGAIFNLVGETVIKSNSGGTLGESVEKILKVEAEIPLYNGGKDQATYRQSLSAESTARSRMLEQQHAVDETVRNAWQALRINQETAELLQTQANIAGEFLEIAKEERRLGNRSLIDILSAETTFVNALSSAEAAKTSVALAVYELLHSVGELDVGLFADS